jgi:hypothetical protein
VSYDRVVDDRGIDGLRWWLIWRGVAGEWWVSSRKLVSIIRDSSESITKSFVKFKIFENISKVLYFIVRITKCIF